MKETKIDDMGNYYGGLIVMEYGGKCFWGIENYSEIEWKEIPQELYDTLINYEKTRKKC